MFWSFFIQWNILFEDLYHTCNYLFMSPIFHFKLSKPWRLLDTTFLVSSSPALLPIVTIFLSYSSTEVLLNLSQTLLNISALLSFNLFSKKNRSFILSGVFGLNLATFSPNPLEHVYSLTLPFTPSFNMWIGSTQWTNPSELKIYHRNCKNATLPNMLSFNSDIYCNTMCSHTIILYVLVAEYFWNINDLKIHSMLYFLVRSSYSFH